jgi:hypothetical protein
MAKLLREVVEVTPQVETDEGWAANSIFHKIAAPVTVYVGRYFRSVGAGGVRPLNSQVNGQVQERKRFPNVYENKRTGGESTAPR